MTNRADLVLLPMYDWPEIRHQTDQLWNALRDALRSADITAPDRLDRTVDPEAAWLRPDLCLSQTCGLPFVQNLAGRVTLLGAPDYAIPDTALGHYRSAIVVRADDPREVLQDFRGGGLAVNDRGSQSGYAAMLHHAAPLAESGMFFGGWVCSGSHSESIRLVARGAADLAAIDYVSWRLALRVIPAARSLRVLMVSDPTPALPLITAAGADVAAYRCALNEGLSGLDPTVRETLGISGFQPFDEDDYACISDRLTRAVQHLHRDPVVIGPARAVPKTFVAHFAQ